MLWLSALLLAAAALTWVLVGSRPTTVTAHWPAADDFFTTPGWSPSNATLEKANGNTYITRLYRPTDGGPSMTFTLTTGPSVKTVYRAGADVPFLGSGYESQPVPPKLQAAANGHGLSLLLRGDEGWLQVYAYGERRGLLGNGAVGWTLAVFDTVLGQPNDYYLVRLLAPTGTALDADTAQRAMQLADVLFPRVAGWYGEAAGVAAQPDLNGAPIGAPLRLNATS
jgi:hypothetical protein